MSRTRPRTTVPGHATVRPLQRRSWYRYEPKNRSSAMAPPMETALVAEVPCFAYDPIGKLDPAELAERVIAELAATALVEPREVLDWRHHWLPNAYPVYALE